MARLDDVLVAVQRIHEAPLVSGGWWRALQAVGKVADCDFGALVARDPGTAQVDSILTMDGPAPQPLLQDCFVHALESGNFPSWVQGRAPGVVTPTSALLSDREFERSAFYNEALRPFDGFYGLVLTCARSSQRQVWLGLGRRIGQSDYCMDDVAAMQAVVPHLAIAMEVDARLAQGSRRDAGLAHALENLAVGALLVDAHANVLWANPLADRLLSKGTILMTAGLTLTPDDPAAARRLHRLIASCARPDGIGAAGGTLDITRGRRTLHVLVAPFRSAPHSPFFNWLGQPEPAAVLLFNDEDARADQRKLRLQSRFGLTPAEAAVAMEILRGDGRQAAAARSGVELATLKTHLIHIFEKTGVQRQAALVRLMLDEC